MNFREVIETVVGDIEAAGVHYGLIGGFAMALRGVQRATMDLDFIVLLDDLEKAHAILTRHGYRRVFHSENVSHYLGDGPSWGRIDILHAFRRPSRAMLERAERLEIEPGLWLRVVHVEDLIGLKVQAATNDPRRAEDDWHDIKSLLRVAREQGTRLDWELIGDYLSVFNLGEKIGEMRRWHETD